MHFHFYIWILYSHLEPLKPYKHQAPKLLDLSLMELFYFFALLQISDVCIFSALFNIDKPERLHITKKSLVNWLLILMGTCVKSLLSLF